MLSAREDGSQRGSILSSVFWEMKEETQPRFEELELLSRVLSVDPVSRGATGGPRLTLPMAEGSWGRGLYVRSRVTGQGEACVFHLCIP